MHRVMMVGQQLEMVKAVKLLSALNETPCNLQLCMHQDLAVFKQTQVSGRKTDHLVRVSTTL